MEKTWPRFPVPASKRSRESKARAYTISSREVQIRDGEPSAAMRYTSEPPFEVPAGNGKEPTCEVLGVGVRVIPGVEPGDSPEPDPIDRLDEELLDPELVAPARLSPTAAA